MESMAYLYSILYSTMLEAYYIIRFCPSLYEMFVFEFVHIPLEHVFDIIFGNTNLNKRELPLLYFIS